eukprot:7235602-Prymnesium_polylepis.3
MALARCAPRLDRLRHEGLPLAALGARAAAIHDPQYADGRQGRPGRRTESALLVGRRAAQQRRQRDHQISAHHTSLPSIVHASFYACTHYMYIWPMADDVARGRCR